MTKHRTRDIWNWLTSPRSAVQERERRRHAQLLASLLVIMLPLAILIAAVPPLLRPTESVFSDLDALVVMGSAIFWIVIYILCRTGRYKLATWLSAGLASITIFALAVLDNEIGDLNYLIMPIWLSSLVFPFKDTVYIVSVNLVCLLLVPVFEPRMTLTDIIIRPVSFFSIGAALILIGTRHRDQLEKDRQAELAENQARIKASLREKEVLLQEIHHRVKNNLQIISSLLNLQSRLVEEQSIQEVFRDSQNRIRSMALIHEKLYRSKNLARIDFAEYIHNLTVYLFRSYSADVGRIDLKVKSAGVFLGIDSAIPCGLILNELISNALKHAFPDGQRGEILVELDKTHHNQVVLAVGDNGAGLDRSLDIERPESLGLQLVNALVGQLNGALELDRNSGTVFRITFTAS